MRTINTKIPLITLAVMTLTAFLPIVQILMLQMTAIYLYPFEIIFRTDDMDILNYANLISGVISIIGYYFSERTGVKILYTILTIFFLTSYIALLTEDIKFDNYPYFLPLIALGFLVTTPLLIVGLLKERLTNNDK
jgi:hypothetical protein